MSLHLTPIQVCERLIGKPEQIAAAIGMNEKSPYHWRNARTGRSAGDLPSTNVMRALLAHSAAHQLGLTADHLIWGAPEAEIADILAARATAAPTFKSGRDLQAAE